MTPRVRSTRRCPSRRTTPHAKSPGVSARENAAPAPRARFRDSTKSRREHAPLRGGNDDLLSPRDRVLQDERRDELEILVRREILDPLPRLRVDLAEDLALALERGLPELELLADDEPPLFVGRLRARAALELLAELRAAALAPSSRMAAARVPAARRISADRGLASLLRSSSVCSRST